MRLTNADAAMVLAALDTLGSALAEEGHEWTAGEHAIFERAVELLGGDPTRVTVREEDEADE